MFLSMYCPLCEDIRIEKKKFLRGLKGFKMARKSKSKPKKTFFVKYLYFVTNISTCDKKIKLILIPAIDL